MSHLTERWAALHEATLGETVFWHVTTDPDFKIDPDYHPKGGASEDWGDTGFRYSTPGLFVTHNPELWRYLWAPTGAVYAAEIQCPPGAAHRMGADTDDRDQWFIAKDRLDGCRVLRVVPVGEAIKETRKQGKVFVMLMRDAVPSSKTIHVVDHRRGYGTAEALCGGWGDGEPLKWTTKEYVLNHLPDLGRWGTLCPECLGKLKRQRT